MSDPRNLPNEIKSAITMLAYVFIFMGATAAMAAEQPIIVMQHNDGDHSAKLEIFNNAEGTFYIEKDERNMSCQVRFNHISGNIRLSTDSQDFKPTRGSNTLIDLSFHTCNQPMQANDLAINIRENGVLIVEPKLQTGELQAGLHYMTDHNLFPVEIIIWNREKIAVLAEQFYR